MVSLLLNNASGEDRFLSEDVKIPFSGYTPLTTRYFGDIFQTEMAGFTVLSLNYSGNLNRIFRAKFSATYFIRNGTGTRIGNLISDPGIG